MQIPEKRYYTPEEYLVLEEKADVKSEYIDGEIIPIAGGSVNHNQIALKFKYRIKFCL
jgi:Uma2 family endonuclease